MSSLQHLTIRVEGLIQGVNYRQAARRAAEPLGIAGFARNEPDGSVTIEAEGPADGLERFVEWCRHGPAPAHVDRIDVREGPLMGYEGFARR
jgi:acylphosphatase